jgi:hypothetical protein
VKPPTDTERRAALRRLRLVGERDQLAHERDRLRRELLAALVLAGSSWRQDPRCLDLKKRLEAVAADWSEVITELSPPRCRALAAGRRHTPAAGRRRYLADPCSGDEDQTMNDDLRAAQAKLAGARDLVRILCDRIYRMNEIVRSRRLEHDELIQLAHSMRATQIARDRAMDDARGWRRIVNMLEGRSEPKGSVSLGRRSDAVARLRTASPGYLTSGHKGLVSLGRGSISLGRSSGYLTRMLGPS